MTINAPASLLLLLYELVAEGQGVAPDALRGTDQNDILKEYIARGNYIYPPGPAMRLTTDLFAYCRENVPKWNTVSSAERGEPNHSPLRAMSRARSTFCSAMSSA